MILLPAIDLFEKKAVRLYKGDYENMTVYSENPIEIARDFENKGCTHIHMVDLEGAKDGTTPTFPLWSRWRKKPLCLWKLAAASAIWKRWHVILLPVYPG